MKSAALKSSKENNYTYLLCLCTSLSSDFTPCATVYKPYSII